MHVFPYILDSFLLSPILKCVTFVSLGRSGLCNVKMAGLFATASGWLLETELYSQEILLCPA
jgi:hypothetical protein